MKNSILLILSVLLYDLCYCQTKIKKEDFYSALELICSDMNYIDTNLYHDQAQIMLSVSNYIDSRKVKFLKNGNSCITSDSLANIKIYFVTDLVTDFAAFVVPYVRLDWCAHMYEGGLSRYRGKSLVYYFIKINGKFILKEKEVTWVN